MTTLEPKAGEQVRDVRVTKVWLKIKVAVHGLKLEIGKNSTKA